MMKCGGCCDDVVCMYVISSCQWHMALLQPWLACLNIEDCSLHWVPIRPRFHLVLSHVDEHARRHVLIYGVNATNSVMLLLFGSLEASQLVVSVSVVTST